MVQCICSFLIHNLLTIILLRGAAHVIAVDESSAHVMCIDEWRPTTSTLCPLSLSRKKSQAVSPSYAQSKAKKTIPGEFHGYWWLFRTLHILGYGARLAEERKKEEDEQS